MIRKLLNKLMFMEVLAMSRTTAEDPAQKCNFRVTIAGIPSTIGFQKVSGLNREYGTTTYIESGYDYEHKLAGRQKVGDVTLERGMFADTTMEDLFKKVLNDKNSRFTMKIELLDKTRKTLREWTLLECFVSKWENTDMDATSEDVAIEKIKC